MSRPDPWARTPPPRPEPLAYRLDEAARLLGVSRRTLHHWLQLGRIAFVQAGVRLRLIPRAALESFLNRGQQAASPAD